jgi:hypothetical protein
LDFGDASRGRPFGLEYLEEVAWAQAALRCPGIERLVESYAAPLTFDGFMGNLKNSVANTGMRIDYDPHDAFGQDCGADAEPPEVVDFYERPTLVDGFPESSRIGDIVVVGDCNAAFVATETSADPWMPVDAATFSATVTFDPQDAEPRLAALWVLRPYGDAQAVVWAETDGLGNYRFRQDVDWFPPALQAWQPIPADGAVQVELAPNVLNREWVLIASLTSIAEAPMLAESAGLTAIVPVAAGPSSTAGTISIDHASPTVSVTCSRFIGAE